VGGREDGAGIDEGEIVVRVGGEELRADVGCIGDGGVERGVDVDGGREVGELDARYMGCGRHCEGRGEVVKVVGKGRCDKHVSVTIIPASHQCFRNAASRILNNVTAAAHYHETNIRLLTSLGVNHHGFVKAFDST